MIVDGCQRWRDRRDSYRPKGEPFDPRSHEVAAIPDDTTAKSFVVRMHYSGSYPAARERFGLYERGALVGVAVFSVPAHPRVLDVLPGSDALAKVELGRFVLLDRVRANGESWFLARCFEQLRRRGYTGVVSFSDPHPRSAADGRLVFPGHVGCIYQATNAVFAGRATARSLRLLPDGSVLNDRALQKVRAREQGWRYVVESLMKAGAPPPSDLADLRPWLRTALAATTRLSRHPGNYRYMFGLTPAVRKRLPASLPYPKLALAAGR